MVAVEAAAAATLTVTIDMNAADVIATAMVRMGKSSSLAAWLVVPSPPGAIYYFPASLKSLHGLLYHQIIKHVANACLLHSGGYSNGGGYGGGGGGGYGGGGYGGGGYGGGGFGGGGFGGGAGGDRMSNLGSGLKTQNWGMCLLLLSSPYRFPLGPLANKV